VFETNKVHCQVAAIALHVIFCTGCTAEMRDVNGAPSVRTHSGVFTFHVLPTTKPLPPASVPAVPVLAVIPDGLVEVAVINAESNLLLGAIGLPTSEASLYPELADLARSVGATHFRVVRTGTAWGYVSSLVAAALAPASAVSSVGGSAEPTPKQ
jgi:hypothetical protein